jgi:hypothetical protein
LSDVPAKEIGQCTCTEVGEERKKMPKKLLAIIPTKLTNDAETCEKKIPSSVQGL